MNNLDEEQCKRLIKGALVQCICAHGPIDFSWTGSACKRIFGGLKSSLEDYLSNKQTAMIRNLQKEIVELKRENGLLRDRLNNKRVKSTLDAGLSEFLDL
jgi:hypothetical protein